MNLFTTHINIVFPLCRSHFIEVHLIVWQFGCYIFTYDCVSYCLLYLMRVDPAPLQHTDYGALTRSNESSESSAGVVDQSANNCCSGSSVDDGAANYVLSAPLLTSPRQNSGDKMRHDCESISSITSNTTVNINTLPIISKSIAGESVVSTVSAMNDEGAFGGGAISQYHYGDVSSELRFHAGSNLRGDCDSLSSSFGETSLSKPRHSVSLQQNRRVLDDSYQFQSYST